MDEVKTVSPGGKRYVEPKGWDELTSDEKIERMREMVKSLQSNLHTTQNVTRRLREIIVGHKHVDGKVVEDIKTYESNIGDCEKASLTSAKLYF